MDKEFLRAGDKGLIKFRFIKKPEYMHVGDTILFREGRTRGKGKIVKIFPIDINLYNKDKKVNTKKVNTQKPKIENNQEKDNNNTTTTKKWKKKNLKYQNKNKENQNNEDKKEKKEEG